MKKQSISRTYCGVPQCKVYRTNGNGVYIFQIPKHVLDSPILSRKWSQVIGIKEPINPRFNICHLHFEKNQVLIPLRGVKRIPVLIKSAFPTLNLPKSKIELINLKVEPVCAVKRSPTHDSDDTKMQSSSRQRNTRNCSVLQCQSYRGNGIHMFSLPKEVLRSPKLLKKWCMILRNGKPFHKYTALCSLHFEKRYIITPLGRKGIIPRARLANGAFPTLNLPKFPDKPPTKLCKIKLKRLLEPALPLTEISDEDEEEDPLSVGVMVNYKNLPTKLLYISSHSKSTMVNLDSFVAFSSLCDTDEKLKSMTGLENNSVLDALVNECLKSRNEDLLMQMRDRIILTMFKLKANCDFMQLSILFQMSEQKATEYFADTIKVLAQYARSLIHWESKEKIIRTLPASFDLFKNVRTVVECIQIKCFPSLKTLISFAPSGLIHFVGKITSGKFSDRALFIQSGLMNKLEPGDGLMADKSIYHRGEFSEAEIEIIALTCDFQKNTKIAAAKADIVSRLENLKKFKVLSEEVDPAVIPFMDDILTFLCGLSNKTLLLFGEST